MHKGRWLTIVTVSAMLVCAAARAEEASVLLEAGVYAEEVVGDLDKAIETYRQIIADAEANRRCVAEAHYRLGTCYLRKNEEEAAVEHFRTVLRDFSDQKAVAERASQAWAKALPRSNAPLVLYTSPEAFADDASPTLDRITVTFDRPMMDGSWSWTGGGETFPQLTGEPHYDATRMTCTLPVKLAPGKVYWVGVNSPSHHFFQTPGHVPARRYVVLFATRDAAGTPTPIPAEMRQQAEGINGPNAPAIPVEPPAGELTFGPVIERVVNDDAVLRECAIDLDTGELFSIPHLFEDRDEGLSWLRERGIDAGCEMGWPGLGFADAALVRVTNEDWKAMPAQLMQELAGASPVPIGRGRESAVIAEGELPVTCFFKTREGGMGILQILELRDQPPRGVKIRYKMVNSGGTEPAHMPQLPAPVMQYIIGKHMAAWAVAQGSGVLANTHIYGVDDGFNRYFGGLLTHRNTLGAAESGPIYLGNFGPERPDYRLIDEAGREQRYELMERPERRLGKYGLIWHPDEPVPAGALRLLGYIRTDTAPLPREEGAARLVMQNTFGDPVLENFFLVVPQGMTIASSTTEPESKQTVGGFDVYLWRKQVPANTEHRVEVTLAAGAASEEPGYWPVERSLSPAARLAELRIRLAEAKAEVAAKEAGCDVLQRALERTTMMHEVGQADAASLDRARLELTRTRAELEAARQKVEILTQEIARIQEADGLSARALEEARRRAEREAERQAVRQALHNVGVAIAMYRADHNGANPGNPQELANGGYLRTEDSPFKRWPGLGWRYVIPDTEQAGEVVLFHWPPVDGEVMVLHHDCAVQSVPVGEDGVLRNPRTRELITTPPDKPASDNAQR